MGAADRVRAYYDALRAGEPLAPFFAPVDGAVKFGVSERLVGPEEIEAGLREQTETTTDWHVESRDLRVTERECHAWFADRVSLAWTDTERQIRFEFETRWSGTLERADHASAGDQTAETDGGSDDGGDEAGGDEAGDDEPGGDGDGYGEDDWQFVGMHVSTARDF